MKGLGQGPNLVKADDTVSASEDEEVDGAVVAFCTHQEAPWDS